MKRFRVQELQNKEHANNWSKIPAMFAHHLTKKKIDNFLVERKTPALNIMLLHSNQKVGCSLLFFFRKSSVIDYASTTLSSSVFPSLHPASLTTVAVGTVAIVGGATDWSSSTNVVFDELDEEDFVALFLDFVEEDEDERLRSVIL
jgi:hypothetical protein